MNDFYSDNNNTRESSFNENEIIVECTQSEEHSRKRSKKKKNDGGFGKFAALTAAFTIAATGTGLGAAYFYEMNVGAGSGNVIPYTESSRVNTPTLDELQAGVVNSQVTHGTASASTEFNSDGTYKYARDLVKAVRDTVVYIEVYIDYRGNLMKYAAGSGVVISEDGYIITNHHVVDKGSAFTVKVNDTASNTSKTYEAKLIGADEPSDLAVLKIDAKGLTAAVLGDSDELYLGDDVLMIGNPLGLETSVTRGVVSGLERRLSDSERGTSSIQTDAAMNDGNSGGALFNFYGEVIGIPNKKCVATYAENVGFAITINEAKVVINNIIEKGNAFSGKTIIGISYSTISQSLAAQYNTSAGFYVASIRSDLAVAKSELKVGDIIVAIDGISALNVDLSDLLSDKKPGDVVKLIVDRNGSIISFDVTLSQGV